MISLDAEALDRLQTASVVVPEIVDPVFGLDESTGSIQAVFQVVAASVIAAIVIGSQLFMGVLITSGTTRDVQPIESVSAHLLTEDDAEDNGEQEYTFYRRYST